MLNNKRRGLAILLALVVGAGVGTAVPKREVKQLKSPPPVERVILPNGTYETKATMDVRFQVVKVTRDKWGKHYGFAAAFRVLEREMKRHRGGGFLLHPPGSDQWSHPYRLGDALDRLRERLWTGAFNKPWKMKAVSDGFAMKVRKVDLNPAVVKATPGTRAVDIIVGTMDKRFNLSNWGIFVCKRIAGTNSWSQHAYKNAVDYGGKYATMKRAAYWMLKLARKGYVPVSQILFDYKNLLTGSAVYDHTNHIHFSGSPLKSGTPACA